MPELYGPLNLVASVLSLALWLAALHRAIVELRRYGDSRASAGFVTISAGVMASLGLTISAVAYVVLDGGIGVWGAAGLGIARGALLSAGLVLAVGGRWRKAP